jgi:predicted Zn-dependent protease
MRLFTRAVCAGVVASTLTVNMASASEQGWRARSSSAVEVTVSDISAEVSFGREIAARILGRYKALDDAELIKYINLVGLTLVRNTNRPELEFYFSVLDTDEINAYAAPGGYIFITKGALKIMQDEAELAGVLGHEIGHVTEMHVVKELKIKGDDNSAVTGLARLVGGSSESARAAFGQAVDKGFEMVFQDAYKREDELQSDRVSVTLTALAGYDASALARYLYRIKPIKEKVVLNEDTHPTIISRVAQIKLLIATDGIDTVKQSKYETRFVESIQSIRILR